MSTNSFDRIFDSLDASLNFQPHPPCPPRSPFPIAFLSPQVKWEVSNQEVPASMTVEVAEFQVKNEVETEHMQTSINLCPDRESELCLPETPLVKEKQSSAPEESSHVTKSVHASISLSPVGQPEFCLPTSPSLTENQSSAPEDILHVTGHVCASPVRQSKLSFPSSPKVTEKQSSAPEDNLHETNHVHASINLSPVRLSELCLASTLPATENNQQHLERICTKQNMCMLLLIYLLVDNPSSLLPICQ